jgi:hypothetical protein
MPGGGPPPRVPAGVVDPRPAAASRGSGDAPAAVAAAPAAPAAQPRVPTPSGRGAAAADDLARALQRIHSGAVRGAAIGLTLRGGLHLASYLLGALGGGGGGRRSPRPVGGLDAARDSLRYAGFLGALAATYIGVDEGIARAFGKERCARGGAWGGRCLHAVRRRGAA